MRSNASIRLGAALALALLAASIPSMHATARVATAPRPEQISMGRASVIDGDTLELQGLRIRLAAVDAPESRQTCRQAGHSWPCGRRAAFALADLIGARAVTCRWRDHDRYRRAVARCEAAGTDLGGWMVEHGWALAFRKYGLSYLPQEDAAREARRGLWAGSFVPPWALRAGHADEVSARTYAGS
jgi:endonuclease YncB( thermonuclease family)